MERMLQVLFPVHWSEQDELLTRLVGNAFDSHLRSTAPRWRWDYDSLSHMGTWAHTWETTDDEAIRIRLTGTEVDKAMLDGWPADLREAIVSFLPTFEQFAAWWDAMPKV